MAEDDLEIIFARRRPYNRFGFALRLCALRYPGRLLAPGEVIPEAVTRFLATQLGLRPTALADYAACEGTRREHLAAVQEVYGYKMFTGRGARDLKVWLEDAAETALSNEDLARCFVEQCRATQTILPGITVIERLCADALVAAERRVDARIASRLGNDVGNRLDALLTEDAGRSVTRFVWLRQLEVGQNSADLGHLLDRLKFLQALALDRGILADVPSHRITRLSRLNEAPYILDGLLMTDACQKIREQYADTGGFTDHVFATTALPAFQFIPRIRDLPSKRLYLFDPASCPKDLKGLSGGKVKEPLIISNWRDIPRCAVIMRTCVMPPSQLLRKFAAYPRQHELAVALLEIGWVKRTLFIIDRPLDADMQRRAQFGLNKGEAHHALKNALRNGRQGEIHDRTTEGPHFRMAGLNLLAAIIIY